jgi:hypothetical protein
LSTLTGATSISSTSLFGQEHSATASKILGFVSISVGIINTLGNYFSYAKKSESHRIAYLHYSKLFSWISVELSLPREERMTAEDMLKSLRVEMERLAETTPMPPESILLEFKEKFKDYDVCKPAETNGLAKISIFRKETMTSVRSACDLRIVIPSAEETSPKDK